MDGCSAGQRWRRYASQIDSLSRSAPCPTSTFGSGPTAWCRTTTSTSAFWSARPMSSDRSGWILRTHRSTSNSSPSRRTPRARARFGFAICYRWQSRCSTTSGCSEGDRATADADWWSGKEGPDQRPKLVAALHDLGVAGGGQDSEPAVGEEVEHLCRVVEADEVAVADHEKRGGGDGPDLVGGPTGEVVNDRLHALEEREEVRWGRRHCLVVGLPCGELLLG